MRLISTGMGYVVLDFLQCMFAKKIKLLCRTQRTVISRYIHFTVVWSETWPLNGSEAGVDLVLIQTSLLL